jgi:hypothetical protein
MQCHARAEMYDACMHAVRVVQALFNLKLSLNHQPAFCSAREYDTNGFQLYGGGASSSAAVGWLVSSALFSVVAMA